MAELADVSTRLRIIRVDETKSPVWLQMAVLPEVFNEIEESRLLTRDLVDLVLNFRGNEKLEARTGEFVNGVD